MLLGSTTLAAQTCDSIFLHNGQSAAVWLERETPTELFFTYCADTLGNDLKSIARDQVARIARANDSRPVFYLVPPPPTIDGSKIRQAIQALRTNTYKRDHPMYWGELGSLVAPGELGQGFYISGTYCFSNQMSISFRSINIGETHVSESSLFGDVASYENWQRYYTIGAGRHYNVPYCHNKFRLAVESGAGIETPINNPVIPFFIKKWSKEEKQNIIPCAYFRISSEWTIFKYIGFNMAVTRYFNRGEIMHPYSINMGFMYGLVR
jgi:hypothetical protein